MKCHFLQLAVAASCLILGGEATFVEQSPAHLSVHFGSTELITCVLKNMAYPWMSWYWQDTKGQLQYLFGTGSKGDKEKTAGPGGSYTAERISETELTLEIANASVSQMIYCTCSTDRGASEAYFGQGTKLTVLEDGIPKTSPTVVLFDPSPQEIKDKGKATLVCLANKFYPDHVTMGWSVNGVERTAGVKTDDSPTRDNASMYFLSSRLRLSKKEWLNPQNTFRCTVHFHSTEASIPEYRETKGREECGMTPDSFRKSANTGKFTYVLLLAKSAFYGLFVTLLVWKMKPPGEKQLF